MTAESAIALTPESAVLFALAAGLAGFSARVHFALWADRRILTIADAYGGAGLGGFLLGLAVVTAGAALRVVL